MIDAVPQRPRELVVSVADPPPGAISDIVEFFEIPTAAVRLVDPAEAETTPEVVIREGDTDILTADIDSLQKAVTTTTEVLQTSNTPDTVSEPLSLLDELTVTTFRSQSVPQLVVASRYVERRAEQSGTGSLYACFQHLSRLETDLRTMVYYSVLADTDLDVHLFGVPDTELANTDGLIVHDADSDELARTWLVAYDGDGVDDRAAALLAQEVGPRQFRGFWTQEVDRVNAIIAYLTDTYCS